MYVNLPYTLGNTYSLSMHVAIQFTRWSCFFDAPSRKTGVLIRLSRWSLIYRSIIHITRKDQAQVMIERRKRIVVSNSLYRQTHRRIVLLRGCILHKTQLQSHGICLEWFLLVYCRSSYCWTLYQTKTIFSQNIDCSWLFLV